MPDNSQLIEVIARCHQELDELFLLHQEAVLLGKFDDAIQLLNCFRDLHHLHMIFEDEQLIPKLLELGDRGRWPASLYTSEHAKIQELLLKTEHSLLSLSKKPLSEKALRREIIGLIDRQKTFKGVCEHHQEREETGILLELDEKTDEDWRTDIIESFLNEWNDGMARNMLIVNKLDWL